jgi:hypothetical protein
MEYDVFISYSHPDKASADAACATLEQAGIRCWIAPRDIVPGMDWGESIVTAITGAKVLVLIFSQHANESPQIKREVERAVAKGLPIIPVRIEDTVPSKALEYFISTPHWLDAFTPPLEERLTQLTAAVKALLGTIQPGRLGPLKAESPPPRGLMGVAARLMDANRLVPVLAVTIGACCLAVLGAGLAAVEGLAQAARVLLGVALAGLILLLAVSHLVTSKRPAIRMAAKALAWGASVVLLVFFALAAAATSFRWPATTASLLGIEDGVVCSRPSELLQAFSCGETDGGYVVTNIDLDDANAGLMVREGPSLQFIGRPIPANSTGVAITAACNFATDTWCQVQCKSRSLSGGSRIRHLRPRSDALYMISANVLLDPNGLVVRSGPHESCQVIGAVPPASRDVIEHGCQKSPLDVATWCRITYAGVSGWVPDGFLERQN